MKEKQNYYKLFIVLWLYATYSLEQYVALHNFHIDIERDPMPCLIITLI